MPLPSAAGCTRVIDVRSQGAATAHRPPRPAEGRAHSEPEQLTLPVLAVLAFEHGVFHPQRGISGKLVEGRLVAAAQLRRAPEQVALDQVVGRLAGAALFGRLIGSRLRS